MLRLTLTLYFTVATLVSPGWCCCSLSACCQVAKQPVCPHCCQRPSEESSCCQVTNLVREQSRRQSQCPCRAQDRPIAALLRSANRSDIELGWLACQHYSSLETPSLPPHPELQSSVAQRWADPFADNVQMRLGLLCRLRC